MGTTINFSAIHKEALYMRTNKDKEMYIHCKHDSKYRVSPPGVFWQT